MSNNRLLRHTVLGIAVAASIATTGMAAEAVRVLILSGQNVHDWKATTPFLEGVYANSGRFRVVGTVEDVSRITADTFARCDVIVSNWTCHPVMTGGPWAPEGKKAFGDAIRSGKGLVQFHAACTACNDWEDFQEVSGLTWKWQSTSHTAIYPFRVVVRDFSHPITQGLSDFWIVDELYQKMAKLSRSEFHLLLEAFADSAYGGTEAWEPVLITTQLGKGRGVNFLLGHDIRAMRNLAWQTLMLRCTEWAATGEVTIPIPPEWPANASLAVATGVDIGATLKAASEYRFGSSRKSVNLLEQVVIASLSRTDAESRRKRRELAAQLAGFLAADIAAEAKSFFCKQLAMVGTSAEVDRIAPLLLDEKTNMMARFALQRISGPAAARTLREAFGKTTGRCRIGIANTLGDMADREAVTMLAEALNDPDEELITACASALGKIADEPAVEAVKSLLDRTSGSFHQAVAEAYLACADRLLKRGDQEAAGEIYLRMYVPGEPAPIRMAALSGIVAAGNQKAPSFVVEALVGGEPRLARVAGRLIRETKELDADRLLADLRETLNSNDPQARGMAIETLAAWPTAKPLDDLFALSAGKLDEHQRAVVSRGIVRLIGTLGDRPPEERIKRAAEALKLPIPLEARKRLLDEAGRTPSPAAMQLGLDSMKDVELADDACAAVTRIGAALPESNRNEVIAAMQKVIAVCKVPEIVRRADVVLRKAAKPVNLAPGASASSPDGLEPDGGSGKDEAAIDGNPETYWDEVDHQKLYRFRLTFNEPTDVSAINIRGHAYRSHSPKDFEILCDDQVVKTVRDAEYDQSSNEYCASFPKARCTSLELRISGYYGASPGIRELEVYNTETGTGGAPYIPLPTGPPICSWSKNGDSVALLNHDRVVWRFVYGQDAPKPFFHPLGLIDGVPLTWESPPDHPWHHGLWFAWNKLNQVNYWEEDGVTHRAEGWTDVVAAQVETADDFSARIVLDIRYHPPGKPTVLSEKRAIQVSAPDDRGNYFIDWEGIFTAGPADVLLQGGTAGGGYAGLSIRIAPTTHDWRLIDSEGREDVPGADALAKNMHGQRARWADFSMVDNASGQSAGLAFLEHPQSLRHPTQWHCVLDARIPFGLFSPSPLWSEPYTLKAGESFVVSYRVLVHRDRLSRETLEAAWRAFAGRHP